MYFYIDVDDACSKCLPWLLEGGGALKSPQLRGKRDHGFGMFGWTRAVGRILGRVILGILGQMKNLNRQPLILTQF